MSRSREV